ncbi:hypothetical protein HOY80DRAFT_1005180 [Tuber brumale]|nr:hypothetical protein HOY80DRAFT_1005180 [Tuber brumale]
MERKSPATVKNAKIPKHITKIGMASEQYYELKLYIKSIAIPGTPAFEGERLSNKRSKLSYHQWLNNTLKDIGPKFFPEGGNGLVWPEDRDRIYKAVHQVVRILSIRIRKKYHKRELRESGGNGEEMAQDNNLGEGKAAVETDDTSGKEDDMILDEDEKYAQWEEEEEKVMALMMAMDQLNQDDDTMEEGTDAEPIELEDLLDLMKPEMFTHFPNLDDGYFDWDEIMDSKFPESLLFDI